MALTSAQVDSAVPIAGTPSRSLTNSALKQLIVDIAAASTPAPAAPVTLTADTVQLSHATHFNRQCILTAAGATNHTLNNDAASGAQAGDILEIDNKGAGTATVLQGTGTLAVATGYTATIAPNTSGTFVFVGSNTWLSATPSASAGGGATLAANTFTGVQTLPAGLSTAPALVIGSESDTGFYRISAYQWGWALGGQLAQKYDSSGSHSLMVNGAGYRVTEGTNCKAGTATLVAGTVTVSNTTVTANSKIYLSHFTPGGTVGWLRVSARTAGTSFTITSSSGTDTSVVSYMIFEPAV